MGVWVLTSVFFVYFLQLPENTICATTNPLLRSVPVGVARQVENLEVNDGIHSAVPAEDNPEPSATNYQPYNVKIHAISEENSRMTNPYDIYGYNDAGSYEETAKQNYFSSAEEEGYNQNLDANGYEHYKTSTSFNLEGPKQLETITTHSFQKEVEPYDVTNFQKSNHKEEEGHAEIHYHQHKHLHKHNHKQEHMHKHQQEHKHEHGHKHEEQAKHEHKHNAQHKHEHKAEHKHNHKAEHQHKHQQEHKHAHQAQHKHEHKHQQEHKHDAKHMHKHEHKAQHKHLQHNEHKHEHQHGHKHENQHKHKHEHKEDHKHKHEHKDEHKHQHHGKHQEKHYYYKYKY